jgi:hypothetical protein
MPGRRSFSFDKRERVWRLRGWRSATILIVSLFAWALLDQHPKVIPPILPELVMALAVLSFVHFLYVVWLRQEYSDETREAIREVIKEERATIAQINALGVVQVYDSRSKALSTIAEKMATADRVWLLGIALHDFLEEGINPDLSRAFRSLAERVQRGNEQKRDFVRIMVLDALKSPTAFRALLEDTPENAENIVINGGKGYESTVPFARFQNLINTFNSLEPLRTRLRFYGHTPLGWMVIVDNDMFYQPYSFGQPLDSLSQRKGIGDALPVFHLNPVSETDMQTSKPCPFDVLEQHFNTLWLTSDTDWYHMKERLENKSYVLDTMFKRRKNWFLHVAQSLKWMSDEAKAGRLATDRRYEARLPFSMESRGQIQFSVVEGDPDLAKAVVNAEIIDCSRSGAQLSLGGSIDVRTRKLIARLPKGQTVLLKEIPGGKITQGGDPSNWRENWLLNRLCSGEPYRVQWTRELSEDPARRKEDSDCVLIGLKRLK